MFKTRAILFGVLALFIATVIMASTASALGPYWHVNGSKLGQGVKKQIKLQNKGAVFFQWTASLSPVVNIECKNSIAEGGAIEGNGNNQGQDKGSFKFSQCKPIPPSEPTCKVSEPIITKQLKSHLVTYKGMQSKYADLFEPQEGSVFMIMKTTECGLGVSGEREVIGDVAAEVMPTEAEAQEGLLSFPEPAITTVFLEQQEKNIGLTPPTSFHFKATYGSRLESGERFGVFGH
jgi:hypothetical protein